MIKFFQKIPKTEVFLAAVLFFGMDAKAIEPESIILRNASAEVVIRPDIGRIISFSRLGGANVLWVPEELGVAASTPCYGGLRLMISPEVLWYQIRNPRRSDPATDGGAWSVVRQDVRSVKLKTFSEDMGAEIIWTIRLHEVDAELTLDYRVERTEENPFPLHLWSIAQVPLDGDVYLSRIPHVTEIYRNCLRTKGIESCVDYLPEKCALKFCGEGRSEPMKIGTFGHWIAHVNQGTVFVICTQPPVRLPYIENSNLQVFSFPGKVPFYELEATSPMYMLRPGEKFQTLEKWILMDAPGTEPGAVAAAINHRVIKGQGAVDSGGAD